MKATKKIILLKIAFQNRNIYSSDAVFWFEIGSLLQKFLKTDCHFLFTKSRKKTIKEQMSTSVATATSSEMERS